MEHENPLLRGVGHTNGTQLQFKAVHPLQEILPAGLIRWWRVHVQCLDFFRLNCQFFIHFSFSAYGTVRDLNKHGTAPSFNLMSTLKDLFCPPPLWCKDFRKCLLDGHFISFYCPHLVYHAPVKFEHTKPVPTQQVRSYTDNNFDSGNKSLLHGPVFFDPVKMSYLFWCTSTRRRRYTRTKGSHDSSIFDL